MENNSHKYIAVSYKLYTQNNGLTEMVEEATEEQPFNFLTGFGIALEAFEEALIDIEEGKDFDFTLPQEKAYGTYEEGRVIDLDKAIFTINNHFDHEHIFEGAVVPLQNEDGNRFLGKVVSISDDKVKMDLNHPLAGKDLNFKGKVIESRMATESEVEGFIKHIEQHSCGCGCDDCGDGCDHEHHHDGCGCGHCH